MEGYKHGKGTLWTKSQTKFVGHWDRGKRVGSGKTFFSDGSVTKGMWVDDVQTSVRVVQRAEAVSASY